MDQAKFLKLVDKAADDLRKWVCETPYDANPFIAHHAFKLQPIHFALKPILTYLQLKYPEIARNVKEEWEMVIRYAEGVEGPGRVSHEMDQIDIIIDGTQYALDLSKKLRDISEILRKEPNAVAPAKNDTDVLTEEPTKKKGRSVDQKRLKVLDKIRKHVFEGTEPPRHKWAYLVDKYKFPYDGEKTIRGKLLRTCIERCNPNLFQTINDW
jgi:hypothetical protein